MTKDQVITDKYALYNGDCVSVMQEMPDNSIDLSVYSPPFAGLYNYSSSEFDHSNCASKEEFLQAYEFAVEQIARLTKPGRITCVHCTDVMDSKTENLWDFRHEIIAIHEKYGFQYKNCITIWKEPLKVRMRTMVRSLMHKLIVEDSSNCFTAMPDYLLVFKKKGENKVPVEHSFGLTHYAGATPLLDDHLNVYGLPEGAFNFSAFKNMGDAIEAYRWASFKALQKKYEGHDDPRTHKLSHSIWQRYASAGWDDIRIDNVLPFQDSKDPDDEKHVHPLQLDVIDRLVELYSNPGEVVLTPYAGVGSEVYSPVSMGRKAIGIELKESYFRQMVMNMAECKSRFTGIQQMKMFE